MSGLELRGQDKQYDFLKHHSSKNFQHVAFVADIGGTNSNFGLCAYINHRIELLASWHLKSAHIIDSAVAIAYAYKHLTELYKITPLNVCIAVAGIIDHTNARCKPTNLPFTVELAAIQRYLPACTLSLINDFEAVAYGYSFIEQDSLISVQKGKSQFHGTQAIIGAGTGLGKVMLTWRDDLNRYQALPSEGGHADAPFIDQEEYALATFIKEKFSKDLYPLSWEDILSGRGIQRLYSFFYSRAQKENSIAQHPDLIFAQASSDRQAADTVALFMRFYGRCAKDYALTTLCDGGIFIAGGIAARNVQLLIDSLFLVEFQANSKHQEFLKNVPITLIADYNVSLFGAAAYHLLYC